MEGLIEALLNRARWSWGAWKMPCDAPPNGDTAERLRLSRKNRRGGVDRKNPRSEGSSGCGRFSRSGQANGEPSRDERTFLVTEEK